MKLCTVARMQELLATGEVTIQSEKGLIWLDGFRLGLRLQPVVSKIVGAINLSMPGDVVTMPQALPEVRLATGETVLGSSLEKLAVSDKLIGFMNTRSKYARLGLEMMGSSWLIAPGFGSGTPTSVIFEMVAHQEVYGFSAVEAYAYAMFFELDEAVPVDMRQYDQRFPLSA